MYSISSGLSTSQSVLSITECDFKAVFVPWVDILGGEMNYLLQIVSFPPRNVIKTPF